MAYYGIHGTYRTSGTAPVSRNALSSKARRDDPSFGRTSRALQPGAWNKLYTRRDLSVDNYYSTHSATGWSLGPGHYIDGYRDKSPAARSTVLIRQKKQNPDFRQRSYVPNSRKTVWTDLSYRYPKTSHFGSSVDYWHGREYSKSRDFLSLTKLNGWRGKLSKEGYVASTVKRTERNWHYLDSQEVEEIDENFVYRTSCGTSDESSEQRDSVISRTRRMKLQKTSTAPETSESGIQVDVVELNEHNEEEKKRKRRSFLSSRHHSWYNTNSYNRYLTPMPWRGSYCSPRRPSPTADEHPDEPPSKDFRKSALNVDLSQSEAQIFAEKQAEMRWRKAVEDSSEDGSPSETGYDSSFTDAEKSSGEVESFFTDSFERFSEYIPDSPRSTLYGDDQHFFDFSNASDEHSSKEMYEDMLSQFHPNTLFAETQDCTDMGEFLPQHASSSDNLEDLCFRFKSMNEESSQRDSGFAEMCVESPAIYDDTLSASTQCDKQAFIGAYNDIDQLLMDKDLDTEAFQTFEDFERRLNRQNSNTRSSRTCSNSSRKWSRTGLRLDIGACTRFIGACRDIDEMLGQPTPLSPDSDSNREKSPPKEDETSLFSSSDMTQSSDCEVESISSETTLLNAWTEKNELDDCTLQLYRGTEGDYGNYLDLESTIDEQAEDFEDFHGNRKNAIILRTQLSVRVHAIIEKLLNSSGRELRRALFSLKQIFQDDKDLVHEFVQSDGLACLIKVGSEADQNYQNYILRALGQVMLYVDGMNGVVNHIETIQWLYSLISSKYRLVVKTALKLLLVFVEYSESNSLLLMDTVCYIDAQKGSIPWSNIMNLLKEKDSADMELLVYAVTLINKTLNGIPDQDTYYDIVDNLEEQGMENVIQYYMSKQGTDLDLLQQFQIYEAVLKHEDGELDTKPLPIDARQVPRSRKFISDETDRRKSRRHSVGTVNGTPQPEKFHSRSLENTPEETTFSWKDRNHNNMESRKSNGYVNGQVNGNGSIDSSLEMNGITPALRRRRERDARNKSLIKEQEESGRGAKYQRSDSLSSSSSTCGPLVKDISIVDKHRSRFENHVQHENRKNNELSLSKDDKKLSVEKSKLNDLNRPTTLSYGVNGSNKKSWMLSMMYSKSQEEDGKLNSDASVRNGVEIVNNNYIVYNKKDNIISNCNLNNLKSDSSVKDMQDKFIYHNGEMNLSSPSSEIAPRVGDHHGIVSRAKEGLAASKLRPELKSPSPISPTSSFIQKADSDIQWEQLINSVKRPLIINDLDFTDLRPEEDINLFGSLEADVGCEVNGGPPPPPLPPGLGPPPPPPPLPLEGGPIPPPPLPQIVASNSVPRLSNGVNNLSLPQTYLKRNQHHSQANHAKDHSKANQKTKKTVKLFWREVKEDKSLLKKIGRKKTIWDELKPVTIDTQKLEHLFENRVKDIVNKEKSQECGKRSEIIVLDTKRSNAINIGMTKLPPPRTIKTAILKMDSTIMNREGIEKILTMLPTEDEKARIAEAQMNNPDTPLGTAEQFLLTLSSISELEARLRLWAFRLDYETMEKEVAEPLMDLKQAIREIESSETFRVILSTLRSVGNFLNGVEIKGFHIEYLSKVPEVKDTVQKHSLLHHLCHIVMEKFPKSCDLYSEIGSVTRTSKIDYGEVTKSLNKMESECKASWDYLKAILKHDCNITMKVRTTEFLSDCAERIIVLKVVHRRMINRYHKFLVYLGCSSQTIEELPIQKCCKILSEFALEYRTTRERVLQQIEKKANHRERNKTRGKMITDMDKFKTKEQLADQELRQLLGNPSISPEDCKTQKWGTVPGIRGRVRPQLGSGGSLGRHSAPVKDENLTDADDEILESLVKTATTQSSRNEPRIRKKARYGDRKSLRRTLKGGLELSEEERNMLSSLTT